MKKVLEVAGAPGRHWVGNGFPVHGMFGYSGPGVAERSPFLLLDYAAPTQFEPTRERRGVGQHPHRGFETVTIVYAGEVEHRDSTGNGGIIGKGDVQWMTAAGGILHEEFHSPAYAAKGGPFEMVQLWVNLPAKDKLAQAGHPGPARTFSPMNVWDIRMTAGKRVELPQPEGWSTLIVVLDGTVQINGEAVLRAAQLATLSTAGSGVMVEANSNAKLLLLAGEPIDEPVVGYGPFVMNTQAEIAEAIRDFNGGKFGQMH